VILDARFPTPAPRDPRPKGRVSRGRSFFRLLNTNETLSRLLSETT
jgi:hypothetical protein